MHIFEKDVLVFMHHKARRVSTLKYLFNEDHQKVICQICVITVAYKFLYAFSVGRGRKVTLKVVKRNKYKKVSYLNRVENKLVSTGI